MEGREVISIQEEEHLIQHLNEELKFVSKRRVREEAKEEKDWIEYNKETE